MNVLVNGHGMMVMERDETDGWVGRVAATSSFGLIIWSHSLVFDYVL